MNKDQLQSTLNKHFPISVSSIEEGPRQFVADTFVVTTTTKQKFFVKVTTKKPFVAETIASLPALYELHELGIDFVNFPLKTKNNEFYILESDNLIVLYNYIAADQSYEYDLNTFGELTATIHKTSSRLTTQPPRENFQYKFSKTFERVVNLRSNSTELNTLIEKHSQMLSKYYKLFTKLSTLLQKSNHDQFVITNGDAPGNVLVKTKTDLYIVDWDELKLAPPERDLWFLCDKPSFMDGYRKIFPNYKVNQLNKYFCVLNYFFNSCVHYTNEIESALSEKESSQYLDGLKGFIDRKQSWIDKYLKEIDNDQRVANF